ncbi:MAG: septum formation protein Maf [Clostridia bacterium]|nr:septum formation protein Maf [Clostridia bacterium]
MKIILASKSPRRRELLGQLYGDFDIITAETDETLPSGIHPSLGVAMLAERKGRAVLDKLTYEGACTDDMLIISSDTLVELGGVPLGKPRDAAEAHEMLRALSGVWHNVHTGIALHYGGKVLSGTATTAVHFRDITDGEIDEYIKSGEPMDKAGSYGIQGLGGAFVTEISGDLDTVIGLSVRLLRRLISDITTEGNSDDKV